MLQPYGLEQADDFRSVFHGPADPFGFRRRGGCTGYHRATLLLQFLDGVWSFVAAGPAPVVDGPPFGSLAGSLTVIVLQAWQELVKTALAHAGGHFARWSSFNQAARRGREFGASVVSEMKNAMVAYQACLS